MSDSEVEIIVDTIAHDPTIGDEIPGTGGCRKVRFAGRGKGKSGGYRVVTFFSGASLPVFLITVFGKGEKSNLTKAECNGLLSLTKTIVAEYKNRVVRVGEKP